jgi:hypothetical protein
MLAARAPSAAQIWRVKAATDVFPLVPVTAAIVAGWRRKNFAAASASARRAPDEGDCFRQRRRRRPFGHDGHGAGRQCLRDEAQPVVFGSRHRHEHIAWRDHAAVGADALDFERVEARLDDGVGSEQVLELHWLRDRILMPSPEKRGRVGR